MLEVTAYDGERVVAQAAVEVQVLDDSTEFEEPQPDHARLEAIARGSGGKVLGGPEELATLLGGLNTSPGEVVVHKAPRWDNAGWWLLLIGLLTAEWSLRRWWGLA